MIHSRTKLANVVTVIGLCIGLIVAIAVPAGYALVAYSQLTRELALVAESKATKLAQYIYRHQAFWQYQSHRLAELVEVPDASEVASRQRIFDANGKLVFETGHAPSFPVAQARVPIVVGGLTVGTIETATTYRPIVFDTAFWRC